MVKIGLVFLLLVFVSTDGAQAQKYRDAEGRLRVAIVINSYNGDRAGPETDLDAETMLKGGLLDTLAARRVVVESVETVKLDADQERQYGRWNRFGVANGHLAEIAATNEKARRFNIGLYNNCSSLSGMLGGLQQSGRDGRLLNVGLVWIDAHGDYNTPETTLSGMLGGMPVAIAAGHALTRMRIQSGLEIALPTEQIVMACVRDTDPLEQERIELSNIEHISVQDIREGSPAVRHQMDRLSEATDLIYVHIDLDVLDPAEVSGHPLTVPNGPTSDELSRALKIMFTYDKAAALGIASYPHTADPDKTTLKAVYKLILGAIDGLSSRSGH